VIPVEMRVDHEVDLPRLDADRRQGLDQVRPPVDPEHLVEAIVLLRPDAGIDQNRLATAADEQAIGLEPDAVRVVRGGELLPHDPRHHAEHRSPVEPELSVPDHVELETPDVHPMHGRVAAHGRTSSGRER